MTKLDIMMFVIGIVCYISTIRGLKQYERRVAAYDAYEEKKRLYLQNLDKKRREDNDKKAALERKAEASLALSQKQFDNKITPSSDLKIKKSA